MRNLSIPLGGGAEERLQVWIRTRPAPADPTSIATLHDEAIAQMAIALRLITLAFGPLHSVHERAHSPSLGTDGSNPALSSGEMLWGGRRGWQFRRLHQSMECRDAPVERFEQVLVEPPSSRRGNLRSCSTVRLLDTPLAHRSSAASRRRDERIKRQRSPKGDQERFARQNEWLL